jgi:hypothetical protein
MSVTGAGVGAAPSNGSSVGSVTIVSGSLGAETQAGSSISANDVVLEGSVALTLAAATQAAVVGQSVLLRGCVVVAATNTRKVFGVTPTVDGIIDLSFVYDNVTTEPTESVPGLLGMELGRVTIPAGVWGVTISTDPPPWSKAVIFNGAAMRRMYVTVSRPGEYFLTAESEAGQGYLVSDQAEVFTIGSGTLFVADVHFVAQTPSPSLSPEHGKEILIALIVTGSVLAAVIVGLVVFFIVKCVRRRRMARKDESSILTDKLLGDPSAYFDT